MNVETWDVIRLGRGLEVVASTEHVMVWWRAEAWELDNRTRSIRKLKLESHAVKQLSTELNFLLFRSDIPELWRRATAELRRWYRVYSFSRE